MTGAVSRCVLAIACLLPLLAFSGDKGGAVEGTVVGEGGGIVKGAVIVIDSGEGRHQYKAQTDKNGHFFYGGLPPGDYNITVVGPERRVLKEVSGFRIEAGTVRDLSIRGGASSSRAAAPALPGLFRIPFGNAGALEVRYNASTEQTFGTLCKNNVWGQITNDSSLPISCAMVQPLGDPIDVNFLALGIVAVRLSSHASQDFSRSATDSVRLTGVTGWKGLSCLTPIVYTFESETMVANFGAGVVIARIGGSRIAITVSNESDQPFEIDWNSSSFVDIARTAKRIFHSGVKYADREQSLPSTTIPPHAKVDDSVIPSANVSFSQAVGDWLEGRLVPPAVASDVVETMIGSIKGGQVSLFLQMIVVGKKVPVTMTFTISDVRVGVLSN
jgi:hypothetical protein